MRPNDISFLECLDLELERDQWEAEQRLTIAKHQAIQAYDLSEQLSRFGVINGVLDVCGKLCE